MLVNNSLDRGHLKSNRVRVRGYGFRVQGWYRNFVYSLPNEIPSDRYSTILGVHNYLLDLLQVEDFSSLDPSRSLSRYVHSKA